jgi:tetratricopeptide (TPR) repeat protein
MGEIFEMEGDFAGAEEAFRIALRINESLGLPDVIALSLTQLARILINRGELPAAERYAQRSLDENDRASNREGVIASNHLLGRIYGLTGRTDLAISLLERAADDYAEVRNPTGEAWARLHLAKVQKQAGHDHVAQNSLERAQFIASGLRNNSLREQAEESL